MANHQIYINYMPGVPLAAWTLDGNPPPSTARINVSSGDTVEFGFAYPDNVTNAVLLTGPLSKNISQSPFRGGAQLNIYSGATVPIETSETEAAWGFSVSFSVINGGKTSMYFLPDPELEVGSIPNL